MRISKCLITLALGTLTVAQCGFAQGRSKAKDQENNNKFVATDTSWKNLSVREKIGQTMMVISKFYDQKKEGNGDMKEFMRKYPIGGFFIARWYFDNYQKEYNNAKDEKGKKDKNDEINDEKNILIYTDSCKHFYSV